LAWAYALGGQYRTSEHLIGEAVASPLNTGDPRTLLPSVWLDGPLHVPDVILRCEGLLRSDPPPRTVASCYRALAVLRAMQGKFEAARELTSENRRILQELGLAVLDAGSAYVEGTIELLAGDPRSAEQVLRVGVAELELLGETMHAANLAALLARALLEQGRDDEVEAILASAHKASALEVSSRVTFRAVLAQLLARTGFQRRAKLVGREAVAMADETESPDLQASARSALAQVFIACGHDARGQAELGRALALYEQKGNLVEAARTRALLSS
jgi:ATP/maltotriose-dependent transcriptional regulator MalT